MSLSLPAVSFFIFFFLSSERTKSRKASLEKRGRGVEKEERPPFTQSLLVYLSSRVGSGKNIKVRETYVRSQYQHRWSWIKHIELAPGECFLVSWKWTNPYSVKQLRQRRQREPNYMNLTTILRLVRYKIVNISFLFTVQNNNMKWQNSNIYGDLTQTTVNFLHFSDLS